MISHFSYSANWHSNTRKLLRTLFPVVVFLLLSAAGWSNEAPVLDPVEDKSVCQQSLLAFTATATDADPPDQLTFSLEGETYGAAIDALSGEFSWIPAESYSGPYQFTVRVTDNGDPVLYDEEIITVTVNPIPSTPVVSSNSPVCEGSDLIFTVEEIPGATYFWEGPNSYTSTDQNPVVSAVTSVSAGTYSVTATVDDCASAEGTVEVTVNPIPSTPVVSSNSPVCEGSDLIFTVEEIPGATYFWTGPNSYTSTDQNPVVSSVTSVSAGTYSVTATVDDCASAEGTVEVTVNALPTITISSAATCASDLQTYSLEVTVSEGTVTSTAGTVTDLGANVWSITEVPAGTNITVTVEDNNGCTNSVSVTAPDCSCPVIEAPVSGGDKSYCENGTIPELTVTVGEGETADWYDSETGGTLLERGSLSYTPLVAGDYYAEARQIASGCISSTRTLVRLTMDPLPGPAETIEGPSAVCQDDTFPYFIEHVANANGYSWSYSGSGVTLSGGTANYTEVSFSRDAVSGTLTVYAYNACGQGIESSLDITVNPLPGDPLFIIGPGHLCPNSSELYFVEGITYASSYEWEYDGTGVFMSHDTVNDPPNSIKLEFHHDATSGILRVSGVNECGISSLISIYITVYPLNEPVISGPSSVCEGSEGNLYTTEPGMNFYSWWTSSGGIITEGEGTNSITVTWTTPGEK
ncbi:MAG: cadherin repeat domain-containing protein, partial [Bacteroidetes bacterium]|nr:cadherin repeat domain-containing protein [Bacteroidota bacterium]